MALQTIQSTSRSGINLDSLAVAADGAGETWAGSGAELVYISNASGVSITATLTVQATIDGGTVSGKVVTVPAGKHFIAGPWPTQWYNDTASPALVHLAWSATASVTVCVFKPGN